jgi:superfamily II DNA or RNA helicase
MLPINHFDTPNLNFNHSWRPEQQRVLDNVLGYLDDKRIHIVAAPGAGKTVIGIEIFNRLNLKALVVSPTRLIRNQWLERITDFLPSDEIPNWCSATISDCKKFTATTYQGLFSLDKKINQNDEQAQFQCISQWFTQQQFKLLILDEAHHLKAAWWKVLMKFVELNNNLIIISLTATPPYDASPQEWSRYQKLCGPVDEQISIPELVRSNSLCPHQDYIWMVKTDEKNVTSLIRHQQNLAKFIKSLENHAELNYLISTHQWLDENQVIEVNDLFYDLDECIALLSLLKHRQRALPDRLLSILEITPDEIPAMSLSSWEELLQGFLDGKHYPQAQVIETFREALATLLKSKRFLKNKRITLDSTKRKLDAFNKTQERIKACFDIAHLEYKCRKDWMRLVVLSDFIRDEKFQLALDGLEAPTGAYPIFHYFIHHFENKLSLKTVLLTGRLAIIPRELIAAVADLLPNNKTVDFEDYSENKDFVVVTNKTDELSAAFTELHKNGTVLIIIGTRSLLGEGWDAPHVNALVMATQTGAYVTSNQIRGRAIRIDTSDDMKTSSIWHIVAVAANSSYNKYIFNDLHKRFKTFAGLHANELKIESGIQRLTLLDELNPEENIINQSNQIMSKRLNDDIFNLQARWQNALEKVTHHRLKTGLQIDFEKSKQNNLSRYVAKLDSQVSQRYKKYKRLSLASLLFAPIAISLTGLSSLIPVLSASGVITASSFVINKFINSRAVVGLNPKQYSQLFATVVLETLHQLDLMQTNKINIKSGLIITEVDDGYFRFSLANHTHKDNEVFLEALSQLLEEIKRPRYLIALTKKPSIHDIFPVPAIFGINNKSANVFLNQWKKHLPKFKQSHLIASSSEQGRSILLKLLAKNYSQEKDNEIRLIERWE